MGSCVAKDSKAGSSFSNSKEEKEIIISDLISSSNIQDIDIDKANINFKQTEARHTFPQRLVRQKCQSDIDDQDTTMTTINQNNYTSINSQAVFSSLVNPAMNQSSNNTSNSNLPSLNLSNTTLPNINFLNDMTCSSTSQPNRISRKSLNIPKQTPFKRKNLANKQSSHTVIDVNHKLQNDHQPLLFRHHSQSTSSSQFSPNHQLTSSPLSLSNFPQISFQQSLNNADSSLQNILDIINRPNVELTTIKQLCDSYLENKAKEMDESSEEFASIVKILVMSLFKQKLSSLGKCYLEKLMLQRTNNSQQTLLKNLADYQKKRE